MLNINRQAPLNHQCLAFLYANPMGIGARLRQLRKRSHLSGEKFGELCGRTKGAVSQWESDLITPPLENLIELRKHMDFSFDWLLSGTAGYTTHDPELAPIMRALEARAEYESGSLLPDDRQILAMSEHLPSDELLALVDRVRQQHASKGALLAALLDRWREDESREPPPAPEPQPAAASEKSPPSAEESLRALERIHDKYTGRAPAKRSDKKRSA